MQNKNHHKKINGHIPQKRFGQNFLQDSEIIHKIVDAIKSHATVDEIIVEIGPGFGAITEILYKNFHNLHAIELDKFLALSLKDKFPNLSLHTMDALKFNFADFSQNLQQKIHVVGNLPYNISSPLLLHLLAHIDAIKSQYFMLQKEVVERMVAQPKSKEYGRISILLQAHYTMYKDIHVPPSAFFPPPKVNSATVFMKPNIKLNKQSSKVLEYITRICFSQRRKMLRSFVEQKSRFEEYGFALHRRAEEISVEEYIEVAQWWSKMYTDAS
jgi:16S rRNA (adenine1518-N6/adenine1519-N6)-dimethyltransferase